MEKKEKCHEFLREEVLPILIFGNRNEEDYFIILFKNGENSFLKLFKSSSPKTSKKEAHVISIKSSDLISVEECPENFSILLKTNMFGKIKINTASKEDMSSWFKDILAFKRTPKCISQETIKQPAECQDTSINNTIYEVQFIKLHEDYESNIPKNIILKMEIFGRQYILVRTIDRCLVESWPLDTIRTFKFPFETVKFVVGRRATNDNISKTYEFWICQDSKKRFRSQIESFMHSAPKSQQTIEGYRKSSTIVLSTSPPTDQLVTQSIERSPFVRPPILRPPIVRPPIVRPPIVRLPYGTLPLARPRFLRPSLINPPRLKMGLRPLFQRPQIPFYPQTSTLPWMNTPRQQFPNDGHPISQARLFIPRTPKPALPFSSNSQIGSQISKIQSNERRSTCLSYSSSEELNFETLNQFSQPNMLGNSHQEIHNSPSTDNFNCNESFASSKRYKSESCLIVQSKISDNQNAVNFRSPSIDEHVSSHVCLRPLKPPPPTQKKPPMGKSFDEYGIYDSQPMENRTKFQNAIVPGFDEYEPPLQESKNKATIIPSFDEYEAYEEATLPLDIQQNTTGNKSTISPSNNATSKVLQTINSSQKKISTDYERPPSDPDTPFTQKQKVVPGFDEYETEFSIEESCCEIELNKNTKTFDKDDRKSSISNKFTNLNNFFKEVNKNHKYPSLQPVVLLEQIKQKLNVMSTKHLTRYPGPLNGSLYTRAKKKRKSSKSFPKMVSK